MILVNLSAQFIQFLIVHKSGSEKVKVVVEKNAHVITDCALVGLSDACEDAMDISVGIGNPRLL